MKRAALTEDEFEPRVDFEPHRLTDARLARVWYSKAVARYQVQLELIDQALRDLDLIDRSTGLIKSGLDILLLTLPNVYAAPGSIFIDSVPLRG